MLERTKQEVVDSARKVFTSAGEGRKNPQSDEVRATVESKEVT